MKRSPLKRSGKLRRSSSLRQTHGLRPGKAPKPVSDRKAAERREAHDVRFKYLRDNPWCQIGEAMAASPDPKIRQLYRKTCRGRADAIHEKQKRSAGGSISDPANFASACNPCNDLMEDEPKVARSIGMVIWAWEVVSDEND